MRRDDKTREHLFKDRNLAALARDAGLGKSTIYNRRDNPGTITLDELVGLTLGMSDEQIVKIVKDRR